MSKQIYKENGIIIANVPAFSKYDAINAFIEEYTEIVNTEKNAHILLNILELKDTPDSETRAMLFNKMKNLRKLNKHEKKAITVKNIGHRLILQSILTVSKHNDQVKYFKSTKEALTWLKSPDF